MSGVSKRAGADPVEVVDYRRHRAHRADGRLASARAPFKDGLLADESIYFDVATLCEQAGLSVDEMRAAAKSRAAGGSVPSPGS